MSLQKFSCKICLLTIINLLILLSLSSCNTTEISSISYKERGVLVSQILIFREEYPNKLTNRSYTDIVTYDLTDADVRKTLDSLFFSCSLGNKYYAICQDKSGLCRETSECIKWKKRFLAKDICLEYAEEYLDSEKDIKMLSESGIECSSELYY